MNLSIDFETRSTVDLKKTGVYPYAAHPDTGIWCMAWAIDDDEPQIWRPGMPLPEDFADALRGGVPVRAWNALFERTIWREIMVHRYDLPEIPLEQWYDTAAEAAAMALPRSLDQAALVMGLTEKKDTEGYNLMLRMSRPRSRAGDPLRWWDDDQGKRDRLEAYCIQDVRTERAAAKAVRRLPPHEREVYLLDQRINDRGIQIDRNLVLAASAVADEGTRRADSALHELTRGAVQSVMNHHDLTVWIREQGVDTEGVSKPALAALMAGPLPDEVRHALQLRADAGRTSVAKLDSMLRVAGADDRARGLLLYHGAGTGRWSGKLIQPQNFPRGEVPDIESFIPDMLAEDYDMLNQFYHPTVIVSSMLRSMLVAGPGHDLIAGDYSAIEARVLNWLAGEEATLQNFREYDAGNKARDPYVLMAARIGPHMGRQAGKAAELGCGFGMGAEKFVDAAWKVYQVAVDLPQAKEAVLAYRESHPKVKQLWYDVENACLDAIRWPGSVRIINEHLKAVVAGAYLYILLPSGRMLAYAAPKIVEKITPWHEMKDSVTFMGVAPFGPKEWMRLSAYGGLLVENIVQGVARDLMADGMLRLEAQDYVPILSCHDEVVCEIPTGFGSQDEFNRLLAETPLWGRGCPITVEGWRGARYRK